MKYLTIAMRMGIHHSSFYINRNVTKCFPVKHYGDLEAKTNRFYKVKEATIDSCFAYCFYLKC